MTLNVKQENLASILYGMRNEITELKRKATILGWQVDGSTLQLSEEGAYVIGVPVDGINGEHISPDSITADHIVAETITAEEIAAGTITALEISAGSITAVEIAASAITASEIAANVITASHIAAATITSAQIAANTITASNIFAGTITATEIASNTITAAKMNITSGLSSITSNMGSITAGTITGGTIQTAVSGSRVVIDGLGMRGYALDGITKVFEIDVGTGIASFTGLAELDPLSVIPGEALVDGSVNTLQLAAGSVKANTIDAGAVTAQKISVSLPGGTVNFINGNFREPVVGGVIPGWTSLAGHLSIVEDDAIFGKVLKTDSTVSNHSYSYQPITLPKGRHVISCWIKGTSVTPGYATLSVVLSTGTATISTPVALTGTFDWTFCEVSVVVTSASAVVWVFNQLGYTGNTTGIAWWAQFSIQSTVTTTQITPEAITTDQILAGTILGTDIAATTITAANMVVGTITAASAIIADAAITNAKIVSLDAAKITTGFLDAARIDAATITAGMLTATAIDGKTITGALIRTAASGQRVELSGTSPSGLKKYNAGGDVTVKIGETDGLDFLAGTGASPPSDRRLRWRTSGSEDVYELFSYRDATFSQGYVSVVGPSTGGRIAGLILSAHIDFGPIAKIQFSSDLTTSDVHVIAGAFNQTLLANDGSSDFVQKYDNVTWNTVSSFSNGWADFGSPWGSVQYSKDNIRVVRLTGVVKNGTIGARAFSLPAGYRPHQDIMFASSGSAGYAEVQVIASNGDVIVTFPAATTWASLATIEFVAL